MNTIAPFKSCLPLLAAALCLQASATDLYVADYGGDIQAAVDAANPGDTVWVEDGTYVLETEIHVDKAIAVRGINGPGAAIIDGDGTTRCFRLDDVACLIGDLTITNGYVDGDSEYEGAGIWCDYSFLPVITNCIVTGNVAEPDNYGMGGGIYYGTVIDCTIADNRAAQGGGTAESVLVNCRVEGNIATEIGGGLYYGSATNCIIIGNKACPDGPTGEAWGGGGGLYESTAYGCAISGNETGGDGGGACYGYYRNCTFTANTANRGGGVYGAYELYNCIAWHNTMTGSDEGGELPMAGGLAPMAGVLPASGSDLYDCWDAQYSCAPDIDLFGEGNITNNPQLVSYSHIATNSPCVGTGANAYASGVDIDGEAWANPPSMGCDENLGPGTLTGPLDPAIAGPLLVATDHAAEYLFTVDGKPTLVVAEIEGMGTFTNPVGAVEAAWSTPGTNDLVLTAYNETHPSGVSLVRQVVVVSPDAAAIHVSDAGGSDGNDGSSWALAKQTLQAGIDAQGIPGGWVLVADGLYTAETFPVRIDRPVTVQGTNSALAAVIDAGGNGRCVEIASDGAVLRRMTVQNGYAEESGGGILCTAQGATVRDCIVRNNYSASGGGGMSGGTAIGCGFYNNVSDNDGAALYNVVATGCSIAHNESGNAAAYGCILRNCTLVGNSSQFGAGGAFECELYNCIVWHNTCAYPDEGEDIGYGISINVCSPDVEHGVDGCITNNPLLASVSHLAPASPCIGAGSAAEAIGTDIDGEAWLVPPSIGCDEYHGSGSVTGELFLAIDGLALLAQGATAPYAFLAIGPATQTVATLGDGAALTNPVAAVSISWNSPGLHDLVFTAWNDTYPGGASITQQVIVVAQEDCTIHVAPGGNDAHDGSGWALAKQTIQAGVDAQTIYGGRVLVSNGTYAVSSPVAIAAPIKLVGLGGPEETTIDGGDMSQGLYITTHHAVVGDFHIANGYGSSGGGILCVGSGTVISNCWIKGCEATWHGGGGYGGTYIDCTIEGNRARYGGGLADAVATRCLISGNEAYMTGGSVGGGGGGAHNCRLYQCVLENNVATWGGGAQSTDAHSCLFRGNTVARYGGGSNQGHLYNCTIVSNSTQGAYAGGGAAYSQLYNSIVHGNLRGAAEDNIDGGSAYSCCSPDLVHGVDGNTTNAPAFADPAAGNYRLAAGSPCIDAGDNAFVATLVDLDGNARIVGASVDMGAYEYADAGFIDSDGDGMSDADELIAGTNPNDPDDFFRVGGWVAGGGGATLSWGAVSGRVYSVYWTDDLVGQPFLPLTNGLAVGSFEDTGREGDPCGFYLITVELAP